MASSLTNLLGTFILAFSQRSKPSFLKSMIAQNYKSAFAHLCFSHISIFKTTSSSNAEGKPPKVVRLTLTPNVGRCLQRFISLLPYTRYGRFLRNLPPDARRPYLATVSDSIAVLPVDGSHIVALRSNIAFGALRRPTF